MNLIICVLIGIGFWASYHLGKTTQQIEEMERNKPSRITRKK